MLPRRVQNRKEHETMEKSNLRSVSRFLTAAGADDVLLMAAHVAPSVLLETLLRLSCGGAVSDR